MQKSAFDLISELFGVRTRIAHGEAVTVSGLAPDQVVKADPNRVGLILINMGANNVFLAPDGNPSSTRGIVVVANGGLFATNIRDDFSLPTLEWFGQALNGTTVFVMEVLITPNAGDEG